MAADEPVAEFNADRTRCVTDGAVFGFPCYEGEVIGGEFRGVMAGNARDLDTARAWLRGEDVTLRKIWPEVKKAVGE